MNTERQEELSECFAAAAQAVLEFENMDELIVWLHQFVRALAIGSHKELLSSPAALRMALKAAPNDPSLIGMLRNSQLQIVTPPGFKPGDETKN